MEMLQFLSLQAILINPYFAPTVLTVAAIVALYSILFPRGWPATNPFAKDTTRPLQPLVTDQKARDKVLKQGFAQKHVPADLDTIVIGSGGGGLATANILARSGQKVLVLEQHDQAGGCMHSFTEDGFEFDVGIHYIGGMRNNTLLRHLVDQLTEGQLKWWDLHEETDIVALGEPGKARLYPSLAGRERWIRIAKERFPNDHKAIDQFMHMIDTIRKGMVGVFALKLLPKWLTAVLVKTGIIHLITPYFKYSSKSVREVLDDLTDNQELKACLSYSFGDYGSLPQEGSFVVQAMLFFHFLEGASYPRGGATEFAFHMIPVIERAGGKVLVRAPVSRILTDDNGNAVGVRVSKTSGDVDIFAKNIVSTAGVYNTFKELLPKDVSVQSDIYPLLGSQLRHGVGGMSLFVGLKGTTEELRVKGQNVWAFTDNDLNKVTLDYLTKPVEEAVNGYVPLIFITFPSARDPTFHERHPGKSVCTVITLANWNWFKEWEHCKVLKRGARYENLKNALAEKMWQQVLALYPQLKDKVEYFEIGSPLSNKHYIGSPQGEIYGLEHDVNRFGSPDVVMKLRPETSIPGLYLSGQDVFTCGFASVVVTGVLTAGAILGRNCFWDLGALKRRIGNKWDSEKKAQ